MPLEEPSWWYGPRGTLAATLLRPLGALYGAVAWRRLRAARPYRSSLPVICIGNFTAGGTGKTPTALYIATMLRELGETPIFLTRGYGGSLRGPHLVDARIDTAAQVGDEPLLLAAPLDRTAMTNAYVMIARDRAAGAKAIEDLTVERSQQRGDNAKSGYGPDINAKGIKSSKSSKSSRPPSVIIMDDGLQNPSLAKDLTIAVVDGRRGLGNCHCIPAGPLRAALDCQLALTDAIIINQPQGFPAKHQPAAAQASKREQAALEVATWLDQRFSGPIITATTGALGDVSWLAGQQLIAFAGIGAPERFYHLLRHHGATLAATKSFPDHHNFTSAEADSLLALAGRKGAQLVTTQKDLVRLDVTLSRLHELKAQSRTLPIALQLEPKLGAQIRQLLKSALRSRREPRA